MGLETRSIVAESQISTGWTDGLPQADSSGRLRTKSRKRRVIARNIGSFMQNGAPSG